MRGRAAGIAETARLYPISYFRWYGERPFAVFRFRPFKLLHLKIDDYLRMAVESAYRSGRAFLAVGLSQQLIIDVHAQSLKIVIAFFLRDERPYLQGLHVFQLHDRAGDGIAGGVR